MTVFEPRTFNLPLEPLRRNRDLAFQAVDKFDESKIFLKWFVLSAQVFFFCFPPDIGSLHGMINSWRAAIKTFLRESSNFFFFLSSTFFFFPFAFLENLELEIANPSFYVLRRKKLLHLMMTENVLKVVRPLRTTSLSWGMRMMTVACLGKVWLDDGIKIYDKLCNWKYELLTSFHLRKTIFKKTALRSVNLNG